MNAILKIKEQLNYDLQLRNKSWGILGLHLIIHVKITEMNEIHA